MRPDRTVLSLDQFGCLCSTMFRVSPNHLLWVLEGLLDGAVHNDPQNSASLPLPFPDALQEFRVATSGLAAQNGMRSGASVNAVTKSGTNNFHGNAFEFLRDKRFNATSPFAAIGPDGKRVDDGLKRNQYGGTIGRGWNTSCRFRRMTRRWICRG